MYKRSIGGTWIVHGIMERPLVPEGTVADIMNMYRPPGVADREVWLYFVRFLASKLVRTNQVSAKLSILDPLRIKFDVFGPDTELGSARI